ncbi:MAG: hypothetical protein OEL87_00770 [Nanoarchaeota archaeon]|nr:hypothetical protein [Nanoarchaeota archaeon]
MKQFAFMYPIKEIFDVEIRNGAYTWQNPSQEKEWLHKIANATSKKERGIVQDLAFQDKQKLFSRIYFDKLNQCIDERYRSNGFGITYITFNGSGIHNSVDMSPSDRILEVGIDYNTHRTEEKYPDPDYILSQIGETEHLRMAGFHCNDCVKRVAERAYLKGIDVLVDEDLTEFFVNMFNAPGFKIGEYPSVDPRRFDTPSNDSISKEFFNSRKGRPWLWQY